MRAGALGRHNSYALGWAVSRRRERSAIGRISRSGEREGESTGGSSGTMREVEIASGSSCGWHADDCTWGRPFAAVCECALYLDLPHGTLVLDVYTIGHGLDALDDCRSLGTGTTCV